MVEGEAKGEFAGGGGRWEYAVSFQWKMLKLQIWSPRLEVPTVNSDRAWFQISVVCYSCQKDRGVPEAAAFQQILKIIWRGEMAKLQGNLGQTRGMLQNNDQKKFKAEPSLPTKMPYHKV